MKFMTQSLFLTALLSASMLAMAGPEHDRHGRSHDRGPSDPARQLAGALKRLDLNEDQQSAIRTIFEDSRDDLKANRNATRELKEDIRTVLEADMLDEDALATLARQEGELAEERVLLMGTLYSELLGELDDEQRAELQAMRSEREARRQERFSARSERRDS